MNPSQFLPFLALGILTGIASGLFGIGGGIIMVPTLVLLFQLPQATANGISLIAMVLPVGALGILEYYRSGLIDMRHLKWGFTLALGIFLGTFIGAKIIQWIPIKMLSRLFAFLLIYTAFRLWK